MYIYTLISVIFLKKNIRTNYDKSVMDNKIPRKENGGFYCPAPPATESPQRYEFLQIVSYNSVIQKNRVMIDSEE